MITSFATFPRPSESPEETKASLETMLELSGVTNCIVYLNGADVEAYRFKIEADSSAANMTQMNLMFGTVNTTDGDSLTASPSANARNVKQVWQIGGSEGQFAKDHLPPRGNK